MTEDQRTICKLRQENGDLRAAMNCYDEMLIFLDMTRISYESRSEAFDVERLLKGRLPELLKLAKRNRLMLGHHANYWPSDFAMSPQVRP